MKKVIIILLIPLVGFSQISYKDIMSIDSEKMFKKVMIENSWRNSNSNYEEKKERENNGRLHYRWYSEVGSINIDGWYYFEKGSFDFLFLHPQIKTFNSIWDMVKKKCVFFGPFAVSKVHAGKGYGRALISHMENIARKAGMKWVLLYNVNHREDLSGLYSHLGFETLEETVPYPDDSRLTRPSHFIQLRRAL